MVQIAKYAATALLAATLTVGAGVGSATADEEPCAEQQAQVTKAEDALDRVTAVFEKQAARVAKAKENIAKAESKVQKDRARAALEKAKEKRAKAKKAKKAQQMRLQKAQQRLDECLAAQEPGDG